MKGPIIAAVLFALAGCATPAGKQYDAISITEPVTGDVTLILFEAGALEKIGGLLGN